MAFLRRDPSLPASPWLTFALGLVMVAMHVFGHDDAPIAGVEGRLALLEQGAKSVALIADVNEGWRALSAHFVHTSWTHLIFNLAFFLPVAGALEAVLRRSDFLLLLCLTATTSGLFSVAWTPEISAGASGLVYGTLGAAVMVGIHHSHRLARPIRIYFGLWVLPFLAIILLLGANNPQLDHFSHLGGLIGGVAVAPLLRVRTQLCSARENWTKNGLSAAVLACCALLAPPLARGFAPEHTLTVQGISLAVPAGWRADEGLTDEMCADGRTQIGGASSIVRLELDRVTDLSSGGGRNLADRIRDDAGTTLRPNVRARTPLSIGCPRQAAALAPANCEDAIDFEREGVWVRREQRWVHADEAWLVIAFEAPVIWWEKYDETRARIFGSIRAVPCRAREASEGALTSGRGD
jgi:membrane associated rhomboid family serine protease